MWSNERYRHIVTALYGILLECFDTFCSFLWQCFKDLGQSQKARKMCEAAFSMNAVSKEVDLISVFTCVSLGLFHLIFFVSLSKIHQESHYKLSQNNTLLTSVLFWITFFLVFLFVFSGWRGTKGADLALPSARTVMTAIAHSFGNAFSMCYGWSVCGYSIYWEGRHINSLCEWRKVCIK